MSNRQHRGEGEGIRRTPRGRSRALVVAVVLGLVSLALVVVTAALSGGPAAAQGGT